MNLFSIWLKELKSFFQYDAKNWTFLVFQYDSKNWTFFKMLMELNLSSIWITFLHDSQWTLSWSIRVKEWNFFTKKRLKVLNLFETWTPFWIWLKELNFFLHWTQRIELFFNNMTQRIEPFCVWVQNWMISKKIHPKKMYERIEPFRNMTHRIEFFWNEKDSQNWTLLFTDRSEPFFSTWLKEWFFFWLTQKNWTLCQKKSQRVELFFSDSEVKNCFLFQLDSKNWTFFTICLNELNLFLEYDPQNWTFFQYDWKNSELFKNYDSLNWTFFAKKKKWLNALNLSVIRLTELNFFLIRLKELNLPFFFEIWLKESNPFF